MGEQNPHERYCNFTQSERRDYRESQKDFWDLFAVTETAEKRGEAKGRAEGRAEGLAEGRAEGLAAGLAEGEAIGLQKGRDAQNAEIARRMKGDGLPVKSIAQYTGLTEQEINEL